MDYRRRIIDDVLDSAFPGLPAIALEGARGVGKTATASRRANTVLALNETVHDDDVRHLRWLRNQLGSRVADAVVVYTGPHAYRRPDGIAVVPLGLLGP